MEFCAELVLIWIDIVEDTLDDEEFLLYMGESTPAIGWLQIKPTPNKHPQLTLAITILQRQLADLLIDNEHLMYSQWLSGSTNFIPDILSRD